MITPMYDQIVVDMKKVEDEKLKSGLIIPSDEWTKPYNEGTVLAVGDGYKLESGELRPLKVKVGDVVLFRKATEVEVKDNDGKKYFITSEATILAIR
jgi:chaperonin GroES